MPKKDDKALSPPNSDRLGRLQWATLELLGSIVVLEVANFARLLVDVEARPHRISK